MKKLNILISIFILLGIIAYNIYLKQKYSKSYKNELYKKINKLKIFLYITSILMFFVSLIFNIINNMDNSFNSTITYLLNSLGIAILFMPLSLTNLYEKIFNDEEKYSHIKTIVTNIIDSSYIKKFNRA